MCDPVTLAITAATVQTVSGLEQGRKAKNAANQQAEQFDQQAAFERDNAEGEAARIRRAGMVQRGQTLGALAAAGVKIGDGSALDIERQVMEDYSRDEYMALLTGERNARSLSASAGQARQAGKDARRASYVNAATSLLSAGSSVMGASGWRTGGPGFSGTQAPAPIAPRPNVIYSGRG